MFLMKFFFDLDFCLRVTASPFCEEFDPEDKVSLWSRGLSAVSVDSNRSGFVSPCCSPDASPATAWNLSFLHKTVQLFKSVTSPQKLFNFSNLSLLHKNCPTFQTCHFSKKTCPTFQQLMHQMFHIHFTLNNAEDTSSKTKFNFYMQLASSESNSTTLFYSCITNNSMFRCNHLLCKDLA